MKKFSEEVIVGKNKDNKGLVFIECLLCTSTGLAFHHYLT